VSRVVLAMSGGVDSSVAAWLLLRQGHEVIGLFMRHGIEGGRGTAEGGDLRREGAKEASPRRPAGRPGAGEGCDTAAPPARGRKQGCCSAADAADARRVAGILGIPFYALNFEAQFSRIVDYFADEYIAGRTPNPCIVCNTWLKFGKLFEYAESVGAEYVATGHHARVLPCYGTSGEPALLRGRDPAKDQSYVLFGVERRRLGRFLLPVGEYSKDEIRRIAVKLGLRVADKPDSQEICFVPDGEHARLVRRLRPGVDTSGEVVTSEGEVVGRHSGLFNFTVGQRKGLGIAFGDRRYVIRLEPNSRRVVVGTRDELARRELTASAANWLVEEPREPLACQVKIRYRSRAVEAVVEPLGGGRFRVRFAEPRHGVAPGQAAVCYQGDRLLGGGWIE